MISTQLPLGPQGWLRPAVGAALGGVIAGGVGMALLGSNSAALPWLIAPTGASAVLIFAVPASPLAQPWPVIGGSVISASIGIVIGSHLGIPLAAGALALGVAIAVMSILRCLHPPGGACALLYAMGSAGAAGSVPWGWPHILTIMVNILALAITCLVYGKLTGQHWLHRPAPPAAPVPVKRAAAIHSALTEVLDEWDEVIDADVEDLDAIFHAVEQRLKSKQNPSAH